ncbi:MAG: DUF3795 domain-containing protein [Deltaproteobacteria bacterium]
MNELDLGYCGLDCKKCPVFIATATDDQRLRERTAREWSALFGKFLGKDLKPDEMNCSGCRSTGIVFGACVDCPIKRCCGKKGIASCARCDEYDRCSILAGFFSVPHHKPARENLDKMRP